MLPIPVVWKLRVPFCKKAGLCTLIAISFISVLCSITRMVFVFVWTRSTDISWNYPLIPFLANMEACVAIMTSSVPAIYPLLRRSEPNNKWEQAPAPHRLPEKHWETEDSQECTAVPSTAGGTDPSSKRWSFLSRHGSFKSKNKVEDEKHMTTINSQGLRTDGFEESR